jgi:hypothetical protein
MQAMGTHWWLICHHQGRKFRETDASRDTIARRSRETWLYGDLGEADRTQSLYRSGRGKPEFIQVATCLQKVISHRQSYICRLVKGASAKVDRARIEPTPSSIWHGHRSIIRALSCTGIRLVRMICQGMEDVSIQSCTASEFTESQELPKKKNALAQEIATSPPAV